MTKLWKLRGVLFGLAVGWMLGRYLVTPWLDSWLSPQVGLPLAVMLFVGLATEHLNRRLNGLEERAEFANERVGDVEEMLFDPKDRRCRRGE